MVKKNIYEESVSNFVDLKAMNSVGILLNIKKRRKMWVRQNLG